MQSPDLTAWWREVDAFVLEADHPLTLTLYNPQGENDGEAVASLPLRIDTARGVLAGYRTPEALSAIARLTGEDGGVGEVSEPALKAIVLSAQLWVEEQVKELSGAVRLRLRGPDGRGISKRCSLVPAPVLQVVEAIPTDAHLDIVRQMSAVSRDLTGSAAVNYRELGMGVRLVTEGQDARWERLFEASRKQDSHVIEHYQAIFNDLRALVGAKDTRIAELERQLQETHQRNLEALRDDTALRLTADAQKARDEQISRAVRELGTMGIGAAQLLLLSKAGFNPEHMPVVQLLLENPRLVTLLANPEVQAALVNPALLKLLKDPEFLELCSNDEQRHKLLVSLLAFAQAEQASSQSA